VSDIMAARDTAAHLVTEFTGRSRAFVQVQQGCDHRCTFCIIPFGRGPSRSVPMGAVVAQVRTLVEAGYREVVLTGVDIASYGPDLPGAPTLGQLVRRLLALVPDLPRLRLSSLDPAAIDDDLWRVLAEEPRLMPHLHLSLQAGSDLILKRMKRRHLCADARAAIEHARALRPGIAIGADLIAGFPTETDALFAETLAFVESADLPFLHVFPYSERPGTPAARMPVVPVPVRRERAARLRETGRRAARRFFAGQVGRTIAVLAESGDTGHSEHFAPVRFREQVEAGKVVAARVVEATEEGLVAINLVHEVAINIADEVTVNLTHEVGEVETRSGEGEGDRVGTLKDRVGTQKVGVACRPDHPHPRRFAPRAPGQAPGGMPLPPQAGEV
jgi:threonylcarbamoyladenosine tRNA methylthiotransferase MtaB